MCKFVTVFSFHYLQLLTAVVDIGVNLTSSQFDPDRALVLSRSREAGVSAVMATGTTLENSEQSADLARQAPGYVYATAGVHPHRTSTWTSQVERGIEALLARPEVVACGEFGLDYDRMASPAVAQQYAFEAQLALARRCGKPVFLHCRAAHDEFVAMLRPYAGLRGVVHCFTGTRAEGSALLDLGLDLGVTGWLCDERRGLELRAAAATFPLERLHLETDAPYLMPRNAPGGRRHRARNEPAWLPWVAQGLANARGESLEHVARVTAANSRRLFGLASVPATA